MPRHRRPFKGWIWLGALLACTGGAQAAGLLSGTSNIAQFVNFTSLPIDVEANGMGNAVVADGTLFNASAYNPALLANNVDFAEVHLGFNVGNDIVGIAKYMTNSDNINNLQNSLQNVNQAFQDINNGLNASGGPNTTLYNQGVVNLNNAIVNTQNAVTNVTGKSLQVGMGFNIALKFDDHWGFQAYNRTQAAVQISQGGLINDLVLIKALPQMPGNSPSQVRDAAVSLYNATQSILNSLLGSQQQQLANAVATFSNSQNNPGGTQPSDVSTFATTVNNIMNSLDPSQSDKTLFNEIAPINGLVYTDTVLMGTYCTRPLADDPSLSAGMNFKVVNRRITSITSSYLIDQNTNGTSDVGNDIKDDMQKTIVRWGVDLGVLYDFDDPKISLGLSAMDLLHSTATLTTNPGDPLNQNGGPVVIDPAPTVVRAGASWKINRNLLVNADVDDIFSGSSYYEGLNFFSHLDFGFNYNFLGILQLRGGVTNSNLCGGVGLPLGIQYAFAVDNLTQTYNHSLQFDVAF